MDDFNYEEFARRWPEFIARLSKLERQILEMRHYGDRSFKEISEALGETLGMVLKTHHQTMGNLRKWIDGLNGDDSEA